MDAEERLEAALSDRYRIERKIGSGGMATVYLAEDLKHHRLVAVKVLAPELARTLGAERFLREIETVANLTHPHILPLHDSGEADGFLFYVMPYVEGESLRTRLDRERQLPLDDAISIAGEIADALAYAHERGVVHRDVKPENILLEAGHALLADFGVAAAREVKGERLTQPGTSLGTPAYMSPEQATGERDLDGRSDQYALGCVLYEMLAGQPPFMGPTGESLIRQHVMAQPPPLTHLRPSVPAGITTALNRTLAKNPVDRYRSAEELRKALTQEDPASAAGIRRWGRTKSVILIGTFGLALASAAALVSRWPGRGPGLPDNVVAVFPFQNRTGDVQLDDLGPTIAFGITRELGGVNEVKVKAWELVESKVAQSGSASSRDVAEQLGAGRAITGILEFHGDSLVISAQLVKVTTGDVMETVSAIGSKNAPEEVGGEVTSRVMSALAMSLNARDWAWSEYSARVPTLGAFREYRRSWEEFYADDEERSLEHLLAAYQLDTTFLQALALAKDRFMNLGRVAQADSLARVLRSRWNELSPDEQLSVEMNEARNDPQKRLDMARAGFNRRSDAMWGYMLGLFATQLGRPVEAVRTFEQVDYDDPRVQYPWMWTATSDAYHFAGRYEEELRAAREGQERFPDDLELALDEIRALVGLGELGEVFSRLEGIEHRSNKRDWNPGDVLFTAAAELARHGHQEEALEIAERATDWYGRQDPGAYVLGHAYALMFFGQPDAAVDLLEEAGADDTEATELRGTFAMALALAGHQDSAELQAQWFQRIDPPNLYWQAVIAANLGHKDEAVRLLRRSLEEGGSVWGRHSDTGFAPLWGYGPFEDLVKPKG